MNKLLGQLWDLPVIANIFMEHFETEALQKTLKKPEDFSGSVI